MSSQHSAATRNFRPDAAEYEPAKTELDSRGRHMTDYLRACLRWLKADPDTALAALAPHWPPPRRYGRHPHNADADGERTSGGQPQRSNENPSKNARLCSSFPGDTPTERRIVGDTGAELVR